jgi:hypothetical protein
MRKTIVLAVALAAALAGCGVDGTIADYDDVTVYSEPTANAVGGVDQDEVGTLTTMASLTVECHLSVNGFGFYRISYHDGSGYIDDSTSILGEDGELSVDQVPDC